jgi:hypothetical protein
MNALTGNAQNGAAYSIGALTDYSYPELGLTHWHQAAFFSVSGAWGREKPRWITYVLYH